jgi:hypothetical protein
MNCINKTTKSFYKLLRAEIKKPRQVVGLPGLLVLPTSRLKAGTTHKLPGKVGNNYGR